MFNTFSIIFYYPQDVFLKCMQEIPRIEPAFWSQLGELKLNGLHLQEGPIRCLAPFTSCNVTRATKMPGYISMEKRYLPLLEEMQWNEHGEIVSPQLLSAFEHKIGCYCQVFLYCVNSREGIDRFDLNAARQYAIQRTWDSIKSGNAMQLHSLLQPIVAITYCDLKNYKYYYKFAYPCILPPHPFQIRRPTKTVSEYFSKEILDAIVKSFNMNKMPSKKCPHLQLLKFTIEENGSINASLDSMLAWKGPGKDASNCANSRFSGSTEVDDHSEQPFLVMIDPSFDDHRPGQSIHNALIMAAYNWKVSKIRAICIRAVRGLFEPSASLVLELSLPSIEGGFLPKPLLDNFDVETRYVDVSQQFDPVKRASDAVDLNLRLMKWRAAPDVNLEIVSNAKCLLLGAGTLGCNVARTLLGWGVKQITFVDYSMVSYSNPVRQSLFTHEDCMDGGKPKAEAAAAALRKIFPGVNAQGQKLEIPMPGHGALSKSHGIEIRRNIEALDLLVQTHDVVFMLLDTREARWAPTVMCAAHNKIALTSALGFDGLMVMRHGHGVPLNDTGKDDASQKSEGKMGDEICNELNPLLTPGTKPGSPCTRLSCYFCQDVIAPRNSLIGRAMDQQCTVARPGLSPIAGSLVVELMVAILQHPCGIFAPAAGSLKETSLKAEAIDRKFSGIPSLGHVPHMIRANLGGFSQFTLYGEAFEKCPACSPVVVEEFRARGTDFIYNAIHEPGYIESVCGLDVLQREGEMVLQNSNRNRNTPSSDEGIGNHDHKVDQIPDDEDAWEAL